MKGKSHYRAVRHGDLTVLDRIAPARMTTTLFQTQVWLQAWWTAARSMPNVEPFIVEVLAEEPVLLLPLCRRREKWLQIVEFVDAGLSDYNAPILVGRVPLDAESLGSIWRAVSGALPRHDVLRLEKMPERIAGTRNPLVGEVTGLAVKSMQVRTWVADIPAGWTRSARGLWSAKFVSALRRRRRLLTVEQNGYVTSIEDVEQRLSICRAIIDMRRGRVAKTGRRDILERPGVAAFYEFLVRNEGPAAKPHVVGVFADGRLVGGCVGFIHAGRYHGILTGFDDTYARYAPGTLAIAHVFDDCAEREIRTIDFSIGDEDYKLNFGVEPNSLLEYVEAGSPIGMVYVAARALKKRFRNLRRGNWTLRPLRPRPKTSPVVPVAGDRAMRRSRVATPSYSAATSLTSSVQTLKEDR